MRAKDVMSDGVISVSADATVFEAASLLVNAAGQCHAGGRRRGAE